MNWEALVWVLFGVAGLVGLAFYGDRRQQLRAMEAESYRWRCVMFNVCEAALNYRGPAEDDEHRRAQARILDNYLRDYKELKES